MVAVNAYTVHSNRMRLSGALARTYMRYFMAILYQVRLVERNQATIIPHPSRLVIQV